MKRPFHSQANFRRQLGTVPLEPSVGGWFFRCLQCLEAHELSRETEGLGYAAYACPNHPDQITHIPRT